MNENAVRNARLAEQRARASAARDAARWRILWAAWVVAYFVALVLAALLQFGLLASVLTACGLLVATLMLCLEVYRSHGRNQD